MEGEKVISGVLTEGFGGYLDTMKQWYTEGLINPNFTSFAFYPDTPGSVENNECLLYSTILSAFTGNNYFKNHMITNAEVNLQPVVPPALNQGDEPIQWSERITAKDLMYITTSCEDPVLAAKWLDFQYSQQGELLNWYGIEGETYEFDEEGLPQYTDIVLNPGEGASPQTVLQGYSLCWGDSWLGKHNISASHKISTAAAGGTNQELEAVAVWSTPEVNVALPNRSITLTDEESDAITSDLTACTTMIQEYMINYIIGEDITPVEEFQESLLQYGFQKVIDTYQAAYDRYLAR